MLVLIFVFKKKNIYIYRTMTGLKRDTKFEEFYTKDHVSETCIGILNEKFAIDKNFTRIIDPSAGTGSFYNKLKKYKNTIAYDIKKSHPDILLEDFLKLKIDKGDFNTLVIGNPPFGRNSCTAKKFIKKSCEFANIIAFILPLSFRKESMKKSFASNFHLIHEYELDKKSFIRNDIDHDVPCVFQIWEKKDIERKKITTHSPNKYYSFVHKDDNPTIAFRRVGGKAGTFTYTGLFSLTGESHYFIKTSQEINKEILDNLVWETKNTVGPKSISKQELIKNLNEKVFIKNI